MPKRNREENKGEESKDKTYHAQQPRDKTHYGRGSKYAILIDEDHEDLPHGEKEIQEAADENGKSEPSHVRR